MQSLITNKVWFPQEWVIAVNHAPIKTTFTGPFRRSILLEKHTKPLDVYHSTRSIIFKWRKLWTVAALSGSRRLTMITPKAQCAILKEVKKNPWVTAKHLQKSIQLAIIFAHILTIRKTLNKNGVNETPP